MAAPHPRDVTPGECAVVKIGGSLIERGQLRTVASALAEATRPLVIVTGGGPFADLVRAQQQRLRISDAAAHRMAILAMHQTAVMLVDIHPRFVLAESLPSIRHAMHNDRIPVWLPLALAGEEPSIPADWSATSDGLAAWLADYLGSVPVALLKSRGAPPDESAAGLARLGVVDPLFAAIVARAGLAFSIFGPGDNAAFARFIGVQAILPSEAV